MSSVFLSRILYLSNEEKKKGILGKSNICRFYNKSELKDILSIDNQKSYYEHYIHNYSIIKLVIDYDNPNTLSISEIKYIFFKLFFKFISQHIDISYKEYKNGIAISKSNNIQTKLHIVYSNIILTIDQLIYLMKNKFKEYIKIHNENNYFSYVDFSIYKQNFNLRLVYSPKHNKQDQLIPIINKNIFNHLVTYY